MGQFRPQFFESTPCGYGERKEGRTTRIITGFGEFTSVKEFVYGVNDHFELNVVRRVQIVASLLEKYKNELPEDFHVEIFSTDLLSRRQEKPVIVVSTGHTGLQRRIILQLIPRDGAEDAERKFILPAVESWDEYDRVVYERSQQQQR